jgi:hypothetical protein
MRNLLRALLLALPLLAMPARAHAHGEAACSIASCLCKKFSSLAWPCCYTDWGAVGHCGPAGCGPGGCGGCGGGCVGPWYSYWPYNAHFATPPHPELPNRTTKVPTRGAGGPSLPPAATYSPAGAGYYQPVSYPSYWYGH